MNSTMKTKTTTKMIPPPATGAQFGRILKRVRRNKERFIVGENGKAQAVIVSVEDYLRSILPAPAPLRKIQEAAKANGLDRMTLREINTEIKAARRERRAKK